MCDGEDAQCVGDGQGRDATALRADALADEQHHRLLRRLYTTPARTGRRPLLVTVNEHRPTVDARV